MENILVNHPDGLEKNVTVYNVTSVDQAKVVEIAETRFHTNKDVVVFVRHPKTNDTLLICIGPELTDIAVDSGNTAIERWINGTTGIYVRDSVLGHLQWDPTELVYGVLFVKDK